MSLLLRVDVDKPYGRKNIAEKIKSKLKEDYWFPQVDTWGYLNPTEKFLIYCNHNNVKGVFYHRNCTVPNKKVTALLKAGHHELGFHAENTRTPDTFRDELELFRKKTGGMEVRSFTKHGSGQIKIGRYHYPPYEPEKYKVWAKALNLGYYYGNEIAASSADFENNPAFYPKMFWIHGDYRHPELGSIEEIVKIAKQCDVPVIIHPSNFIANPQVNRDFKKLVELAREQSVSWELKS